MGLLCCSGSIKRRASGVGRSGSSLRWWVGVQRCRGDSLLNKVGSLFVGENQSRFSRGSSSTQIHLSHEKIHAVHTRQDDETGPNINDKVPYPRFEAFSDDAGAG